jgi:2',3'-cyclic-nucleotide 2'-phosphodiesterase (5'-nucleotidase family)
MNSVKKGFSSYDLIANTTGIDVVIDGHSHTPNSGEGVSNKDGEMVVLTSTEEKLKLLGVLNIHPDHTYNTVIYTSVDVTDSSVEELLEEIKAK